MRHRYPAYDMLGIIFMEILFQNNHYLIISKPAGLVVHSDGRTDEPTVVDWILATYPEIAGVGEDWENDQGAMILRSGIVHRLDRDTSGVMVIARTQEMFDHLKQQFKDRRIQKEYLAYVYGWVREGMGVINAPLGKSRRDFRRWSASRGARGTLREAITEYEVLKRFTDQKGNQFSYVIFRPKTGRTHQIRVHAQYLNHPLVADTLYAGKNIKKGTLGFDRHALHAHRITFHDLDNTEVSYEASLPPDFTSAQQVSIIEER